MASDSSIARGNGSDVDSFDLSVAEDQGHDSESGYIAEIVDRFVFNEAAVVAGQEYGLFV